jgi:HAD superfamily hydrolase (TIGR01549 family)
MIDAVLFDLDGTLLDRDTSVLAFAHEQHRRLGHAIGHIPVQTYVARFVELDARGTVWKDEVYRRLVAEFRIEGMTPKALLDDYLTRFREHCVPFPNLHATLDQLQSDGLELGIISNGHGTLQLASIEALGIEAYLADVSISELEGLRKPDPAIFRRAVERLGTTVDRAVYVGDNPQADVAGARNAGLRAVWKRDPGWPVPIEADGMIDDLGELPGLIRRLGTIGSS